MRQNAREVLGLRKLGNPEGFQFFSWEFLEPDTVLMEGCVVTRYATKGKRKGLPIYDGPRRKVAVTLSEEKAEKARHEAETGNCGECWGDGKELAGWDHITGTEWRDCRKCAGSGKAQTA